jgi:hypothetical protein
MPGLIIMSIPAYYVNSEGGKCPLQLDEKGFAPPMKVFRRQAQYRASLYFHSIFRLELLYG